MTDETPKSISLTMEGDGMKVAQDIDKRTALHVLQILMASAAGVAMPVASDAAPVAPVASATAATSLREHLDSFGAKKKPEQITTIAHYMYEIEGQTDFNREDIKSRFIKAREPAPGNFARDFNDTIEKGWIAPVHGKKDHFYVTAKGTLALNSKLNGKDAAKRR